MATEPTIEEAKATLEWIAGTKTGIPHFAVSVSVDHLRTLLASHASLEERVKEAKRLMEPFAQQVRGYDKLALEEDTSTICKVADIRALAAFVNEKGT